MPPAARAAELAASAFALFSRRGIAGVTMDEIAAEADVTKGSLYWHYESKDEVVQAACQHYYQEWHKMARRKIAGVDDPVERLRVIVRASVRSCLIDERNRVFTLEILTQSLYDKVIRDGWRQFFDGVRAFYLGLAEAAAGRLRVAHCERAVDTMLSAMEGYKLRAVFEPALCSKAAEEQIAAQLLGLLGAPCRGGRPTINGQR
jgi:TetR/AcrR family transcriptional regulator, mexJK operon transcriptional repressor